MGDRGFGPFLLASLDAIADEAPAAYRVLQRALGNRAVSICVDGERMRLDMTGTRHVLRRVDDACAVDLVTDSPTLVRLLEARCTLVGLAMDGPLFLRGAPEDLAALHDALLAFVHGAARSLSVSKLLNTYLTQAREDYEHDSRAIGT